MADESRDGGPVFPQIESYTGDHGYRIDVTDRGMSLRDHFASEASTNGAKDVVYVLEDGATDPIVAVATARRIARCHAVAAYLLADALLEVRELPREALAIAGLPPVPPDLSDEDRPF